MALLQHLLLGLLLALVLLSVTAAYRLLLHPLASFPGPKLAAVTSWHHGYWHTVGKGRDIQGRLELLHARYGPVVRIEPNLLHFSEPQAYWDIYAPGSTTRKWPTFYNSFQMQLSAAGAIDNKTAKKRRDLISPLFSRRSVLKMEPIIQQTVDKFVSRMAAFAPDRPVNLHFALRSVALDIITRYCFGDDMAANTLDSEGLDHIVLKSNEQRLGVFWWIVKIPFLLPLIYALPNWIADRMSEAGKDIRGLREDSLASIDKILEDPSRLLNSEHETIFHHILNPQSGKRQGITSRQVLVNESDALVGAGSDTIGNSCNIGLFHVLNNQDIKKKLTTELLQAWPDVEKPIGFDVLEKLPYLTAVLKETLRFAHGVVTPIPRQITSASGAVIAGHAVPQGAVVSQTVLFLHSNPIFKNPKQFNPERWLDEDAGRLDQYLQPFTRGPRMCLGQTLAWCELYLIFASVLRKLDLELYDTTIEDFTEISDHFVCTYEGRQLQVLVKSSQLA